MESNPLALPFHTRTSAADNAKAMFEYLGCQVNDVACMKSKTVDEILDAQDHAVKINLSDLLINFLPFAPMVEQNGEIPEQPFEGMMHGRMQSVPLLSGSVLDEGQLFVHELFTTPLDEMAYNVILKGVFGLSSAKQILKMYPFNMVPNTVDGRDALNVLATDLLFYCPLRNMTRGYQKSIDTKTFIYRFNHIESFDCWGPGYTFCVGYVCHGSELPYVWNVFSDGVSIDYPTTDEEKVLTSDLGNAWTNFITTNNPNTGLPVYSFPIYDNLDQLVMVNEPDHSTVDHLRSEYCDMWDKLGYYY
jgi:carboxylesterase type B